jgi:molybdopterin-binding protein
VLPFGDRHTPCHHLQLPRLEQGTHVKISARNTLPGIIRKIEPGAINAEATLELAPQLSVVSAITVDAVKSLNLRVGERAYAVIEASGVMVAVD